MMKHTGLRWIVALSLCVLLCAACAKKPVSTAMNEEGQGVVDSSGIGTPSYGAIGESSIAEDGLGEEGLPGMGQEIAGLERVHFEFDQYTLTAEAREILSRNARFLQSHPEVKIMIEGHCDERGSDEYNLALGERRARAVQSYLASLGISPDRMSIISYGEEIPLDPRSSEEAWAKNRRVDFKKIQ